MSVLMNKANSDVDPTTGYRLQLDVTPYVDFGPNNDFFSIIRLTGRSYFDLAEPGRSVLALRASFGTEPATNVAGIPPDKLFYAGGGGSVRGFVYQSAGPRDAFNNPAGRRQRRRGATSNSASASASRSAPWPSSMPAAPIPTCCPTSRCSRRESAPASARATTPISARCGSMSAFRSTRRDGDPPFGVYVSLGQAF